MAETANNSAVDPMRKRGQELCVKKLAGAAYLPTDVFCNATFDTVLCWPATYPNSTAFLPCPPIVGLDPNKFAYRFCGPDGRWEGRTPGDYSNPVGYTHFNECLTEEARRAYNRHIQSANDTKILKEILGKARTLEVVGLSVSLVCTILSLVIFCYFSGLKCHRTRIHKNLFVAIIVQIAMRILILVDQYIARLVGGEIGGASSGSSEAIYDTPGFCEAMYALLEYTKTVKFMWMFVEGLYLHNMIAVSVFSGQPNYILFYSLGWGLPVLIVISWVIPMATLVKTKCWFAYYYNPLIWILEGPRASVMVINLAFLLNIIRVLVMKLRESRTNEAMKVRKAVKAAIVLLPLLGLTNFVMMLEPQGHRVQFAVWVFSAHFLTDFEGFFISLIYCFLNGEVQSVLKRKLFREFRNNYSLDLSTTHWRNTTIKVRTILKRQVERWRQHRIFHTSSFRRLSRSLSVFTSFSEVLNAATNPNQQQKTSPTQNGCGEQNGSSRMANGNAQNGDVPLLRTFSRRLNPFRRSNTRNGGKRQETEIPEVTEPLKTESIREQEM